MAVGCSMLVGSSKEMLGIHVSAHSCMLCSMLPADMMQELHLHWPAQQAQSRAAGACDG